MNDKYINEDQNELNQINDILASESDFLYMQLEHVERQIAEGKTTVQITVDLVNKIKADAIREAADIDWVIRGNVVAILKSTLLNYADDVENQVTR